MNDIFNKFVDSLRPSCDHMNVDEYEKILELKKKDISTLLEENQRAIRAKESLQRNLFKFHEERQQLEYRWNKALETMEDELSALKKKYEVKSTQYESLHEKYNELLNKIDNFHESLFTRESSSKKKMKKRRQK